MSPWHARSQRATCLISLPKPWRALRPAGSELLCFRSVIESCDICMIPSVYGFSPLRLVRNPRCKGRPRKRPEGRIPTREQDDQAIRGFRRRSRRNQEYPEQVTPRYRTNATKSQYSWDGIEFRSPAGRLDEKLKDELGGADLVGVLEHSITNLSVLIN